jgi:hypothetical protein
VTHARFLSLPLVFASAVALAGCAGGPTDAERDDATTDARAALDIAQALELTDAFLSFDPTLDPSRDATTNAGYVEAQIRASARTCGDIVRSGTSITVNFGPAPGCTLASGAQVSGAVSVNVIIATGVQVTLSLTDLVIDGRGINGTIRALTSTTSGAMLVIHLVLQTSMDIAGDFTVAGSTTGYTVAGSGSITPIGGAPESVIANGVHVSPRSCYPDGGTFAVTKGDVTTTIAFDAMTPSTGMVTVDVGGRATFMLLLPAHGTCPHA